MTIAFFTVCGGGEDYEFLLGSIERHALFGKHLVLDTTPPEAARRFLHLPPSVRWVHEPLYGAGWGNFRLASAAERARQLAEETFNPDVLCYLDSDDFYTEGILDFAFLGLSSMIELQYVHWLKGKPYVFGESEWHRKIWPAKRGVKIERSPTWPTDPLYDGNPENHAQAVAPESLPVVRSNFLIRHHAHYALGEKASDERTAKATIQGWPDRGREAPAIRWPERLGAWRDYGTLPSFAFLGAEKGASPFAALAAATEALGIQGWKTLPELYWLALLASTAKVVIDVGCWRGQTTRAMARVCRGTVYAVDRASGEYTGETGRNTLLPSLSHEQVAEEFRRNLAPEVASEKVVHILGTSTNAAGAIKGLLGEEGAGFVFLDGDHGEEEVRGEIRDYGTLLAPGGVLAGHDYDFHFPGVERAVNELVPGFGRGPHSIWWKRV